MWFSRKRPIQVAIKNTTTSKFELRKAVVSQSGLTILGDNSWADMHGTLILKPDGTITGSEVFDSWIPIANVPDEYWASFAIIGHKHRCVCGIESLIKPNFTRFTNGTA